MAVKNRRPSITVPAAVKTSFLNFAALNSMDQAIVLQMAVTKKCLECPMAEDIPKTNGSGELLNTVMSEQTCNLLELWSQKTNLSKSSLVTYALQETIVKEGGI